ncbi:SMI1/KNR4 family protein [Leeuwenhoekiella marinoflava]|uniref:SMI1/KNR4 family protein n=1 Tax=Leeuwenhoekiella marinoflava TaxID=988 RepID=UPI0030022791
MRNCIAYNEAFVDKKWTDFQFETLEIETLPPLEDPENFRNSFTFRDALLEAVENNAQKPVIKLLLLTPDFVFQFSYYVIAFLEGKEILTVELKQEERFKDWIKVITSDSRKSEKSYPQIFQFGTSQYSSQPASNFEKDFIYIDTGAFLYKFIPNEFIAEKLKKEKADFIRPFVNLNVPSDLKALAEAFRKLIEAKNLEVTVPVANDAVYEAFEKQAGFAFPQVLKDFFTLHNGVKNTAFMTAEAMLNEWKQWNDIYEEWTQEDLLDTYSTNEGKVLLMYTTPYWIPFFDLGNGNFIGLDLAPAEKGTPGQIIRFGADQEIGYQQAESLDAFLKQLLQEEEIVDWEWLLAE